jgi:signal transduction histidine kinase
MEAAVSGIPGRAVLGVVIALALHAVGLQVLAVLAGVTLGAGFWLTAFAVALLAFALAFAALRPLRADLRVVQEFARTSDEERAAPLPPARALETAPLLDGLVQLRTSFVAIAAEQSRAQRKIEEAERLRASFLAAMAHDLRGPLNAVIGFSDLLIIDGLDAVSPAQRPSVDLIRQSALDLLVLLDEILEWAKSEAGQLKLEPAEVALHEIIDAVRSEAHKRSAGRGLAVQCSIAKDLPPMNVDRARIAQALLGLLDHATRTSERPCVMLSASLARGERAPAVRIELRDPQLTVREADQQSYFEAFRPSYAPSGKRVSGLGLGPALARALIRAHGGEVWFTSRSDTGTTFVVELPLPI